MIEQLTYVNGRMSAPKIAQFKINPAKMRLAFFQSKCSSNKFASGANVNVPKPKKNQSKHILFVIWHEIVVSCLIDLFSCQFSH